ncbi:MAG: WHG domain-containing protein [Caldilineaceae bacterium]|nr:WHG domain-containing protein [Caldilineaceae bacterium]MCB0086335.1 WHG domain-containing protein [Caldilineaceae bacterium]MCB0145918.1 WHG domain-containing protein [Caldilineaceae bacterium]MCB9156943.1 WHG domain-containing protein [Caldilineaceae bacterium]
MARSRRLNKAIVVEAAASLIDEAGDPAALSLKTLAAALGVRVPSLYNHIEGLDGLTRAVALWGLQRLLMALRNAAVGKAGPKALIAVAHSYRAFAQAHPGVYLLTLSAPATDDAEMVAIANELVGLLLLLLAPLGLDDTDALHEVRILRSLLHGFVSLEAVGGFGLPLERDETFQRLIDRYLYTFAVEKP